MPGGGSYRDGAPAMSQLDQRPPQPYERAHRHYLPEHLQPGWEFRSPAGRWETISEVCAPEIPLGVTRVWTFDTGPDYAWRLPALQRIEACRDKYDQLRQVRLTIHDSLILAALWPAT